MHVAIAGATGAVGCEMLRCLEDRDFPVTSLRLLASARSVGKRLPFRGGEVAVEELTAGCFEGIDIALFSAGGDRSREFAPAAAAAGAIVIDNSSAFRLDADVPLVIPEINPEAAHTHPRGIIANPNCTTIVTLMAVGPLHRAFGLRALTTSSYQAVSGSGAAGIRELDDQIRAFGRGDDPPPPTVYPCPILSNVIPWVGAATGNGFTDEEMKLTHESRKILSHPGLRAAATCVRVPVHRSHAVSVTARFSQPVDPGQARDFLRQAPGVKVMDDPARAVFPTPMDATGGDECLVGRIRRDLVDDSALCLWVVGDQVRKGAALNAVQIAELLLDR